MSALYVRTLMRQWFTDDSVKTPYYDTVNAEQNPQDDTWMTADFEVTFRERRTFCEGDWMEEGDVGLTFTGLAGVGDGALLAAAEEDVKQLLTFRDPSGQLVVTGVSGVNEVSGGSANVGYQIEYVFEYKYMEK